MELGKISDIHRAHVLATCVLLLARKLDIGRDQDMTSVLNTVADIRVTRMADALTVPDGGFTVDPRNGQDIRNGFAVSIHPECERQIQGKVSAADIRQFVYDNAATLAVEGNVVGGWRCPETGVAYLDVSTIVFDRERAARLAHKYSQVAFWDFRAGVSVMV